MSDENAFSLERLWTANEAFGLIQADKNTDHPDAARLFVENIDAITILQPAIAEILRTELGETSEPELLGAAYDALAESIRGDDIDLISTNALFKYIKKRRYETAQDIDSPTVENETPISQPQVEMPVIIKEHLAKNQVGDTESKSWLVSQYAPYVKSLARKLALKLPQRVTAIDYDDLVQEGMLGLFRAGEIYQADGGAHFMTYSRNHIINRMKKHIKDMGSTVRVPIHTRDKLNKVEAVNWDRRRNQRPLLTTKEIAELVDVEPYDSGACRFSNYSLSVGDLRHTQLISENMGSIDRGFSPHNDISPGNDYIMDERNRIASVTSEPVPSIEDEILRLAMRDDLYKLLDYLSDRERQFLVYRFGFDRNGQPRTLEEVGNMFGITRERVRVIEAKSLATMRGVVAIAGLYSHDYI